MRNPMERAAAEINHDSHRWSAPSTAVKRFGLSLVLTLVVSGVLFAPASAAHRSDNPIPPAPGQVESWIAYFHLGEHVVRIGQILTGTIEIPPIGDCGKGHRCVQSVSVSSGAGLKQLGVCDLKHRHCRWKAIDGADPWQTMTLSISSDLGSAVSNDYYMVVDPFTYVLDGTVASKTSSKGVPGVVLHISGKQRATATTNADGYYAVRLKKGSYVVTPTKAGEHGAFAPAHAHVDVKRTGRNSQNFQLKQSFPSTLVGVTKNGSQVGSGDRIGAVGDTVSFVGKDWDPEGDPVQVFWGKAQIGTYSTPASFSASWQLPVFPDGTCRGSLRAVQADVTRTLILHAGVDGQVAFADGSVHVGVFAGDHVDAVAGARALKPKSLLCEGEGAVVGANGAAIWATAGGAFELVDKPKRIHVWGAVSTPSGTMALTGGRRASFAVGGPDPHSFDPTAKGTPGTTLLAPSFGAGGPVSLNGWNYLNGDAALAASLTLDGGVLYVNGNLTLNGGLSGVGALIVTGNLKITGPVELKTDSTNALVVGGQLTLNGG